MHFAVKMLTPWQRLPNNLFACLSAYGFSLKRPLRALALLWALPIFWDNLTGMPNGCINSAHAFKFALFPLRDVNTTRLM